MVELGKKHECSECETRFYDLGRPSAVCPRCGVDVATGLVEEVPEPAPAPEVVADEPDEDFDVDVDVDVAAEVAEGAAEIEDPELDDLDDA